MSFPAPSSLGAVASCSPGTKGGWELGRGGVEPASFCMLMGQTATQLPVGPRPADITGRPAAHGVM